LDAAFDLALQRGWSIDFRVCGGLLLRAGKAAEAVQSLKLATAMRASELAPPVEEALLALAYHQLNQPAEAKHWFGKAQTWLDKETLPAAAAALVAKLAGAGGFPALTPIAGNSLDPRYRSPDW